MATYYIGTIPCSSELYHYGVKGMKWGEHLFGLAEGLGNIVRYRRGSPGRSMGISGVKKSASGLREDVRNTAYNARQFLTGSEDRKRRNAALSEYNRLMEMAKKSESYGSIATANNQRIQAKKYLAEAEQAQREYETMTLPGMAEKTFRNVRNTLSKYGIDATQFYNNAKQRVSGSMKNIAKGAEKAAAWITTGFSALCKKLGPAFARAKEFVTGSNARANLKSAIGEYQKDSSTKNLNKVVEADNAYRKTVPGAISGAYRDVKKTARNIRKK